ncbi:ABC transporter permease subunit [Rhodococcus triatomae]|uniref:ABC-type nitrate/sulfonate/bicarbonate transport system, permease component n=1 Tax=Rhodococcus triatomae TaxID=300028 RepID=A0A1G8BAZ7_9NOCA|nr:ABC transporter permease subunit [Rhodococcus triatomae]QNG17487.1 ABC transporter permease subunit [Rhodococcus triatomae]QNG22845.1 ABC transporter permease subunit [Rhodococcus triatomae]SDH30274.1 ABC-type nitrate/sulfonate/bicarbonate transport system, permease component [Rhodococcus triatomae]
MTATSTGTGAARAERTDSPAARAEQAPAAPTPPRAQSTTRRRTPRSVLGTLGLRLIVPIAILAGWWALSQSEVGSLVVAQPLDAFERVFTDFFSSDPSRLFLGDATFDHFFPSVYRALAGLALAVVVGVGLGVALGSNRVLTALFQPLIHLGRSLPSPALLGVFFFLFGTGDSPKIFLIAFSVVWPILFNTIDGVQSVGIGRVQAAAVFKIPRRDVLTHIVLPGAAPKIFAGVRTAMSLSLIIMIISELQKSENGLGYLLIQTQRNFDYTGFWSVLIVLAALGVALNFVFVTVERRVLAWHRGVTQQND